jgi:uncharacterized protein YuzE
MKASYDKDADVLYLTFEVAPAEDYLYVENKQGDVLRLSKKSGHVVGCTIPFFSKRAAEHKLDVPEIGRVPFNKLARSLLR